MRQPYRCTSYVSTLKNSTSSTADRALGWAAGRPQSAVHSSPFQSVKCGGGEAVLPSHHTSPSSVSAQLVKMVLRFIARIAEGFDFSDVPKRLFAVQPS